MSNKSKNTQKSQNQKVGGGRVKITRFTLDESGTEHIRPEPYKEPTLKELREFKIVGSPPEED